MPRCLIIIFGHQYAVHVNYLISGSAQLSIHTAQECFKVASGGPKVALELVRDIFKFFWFVLSGERKNYEEEIYFFWKKKFIKKKWLLFLACPGFEPAYVWPVRSDKTLNWGINSILRHCDTRYCDLPRTFRQNWPFFTDCLSAKFAPKIPA